jgi:hypothetical protein
LPTGDSSKWQEKAARPRRGTAKTVSFGIILFHSARRTLKVRFSDDPALMTFGAFKGAIVESMHLNGMPRKTPTLVAPHHHGPELSRAGARTLRRSHGMSVPGVDLAQSQRQDARGDRRGKQGSADDWHIQNTNRQEDHHRAGDNKTSTKPDTKVSESDKH